MAKKGYKTVTLTEEANSKLNGIAEELGKSKIQTINALIKEHEDNRGR
jgi:hypothetical protein